MRLWHIDILDKLPKQWLQGQHRELCALRGLGWNKKHSTIDYIKKYNFLMLYDYHMKVMQLLYDNHNVNIDAIWLLQCYRGKRIGFVSNYPNYDKIKLSKYPEHNDKYYQECIDNLNKKGIII